MELELELTRDDFEKFNRYYLLKKGLKKRLHILIAIVLIVPLLLELGNPIDLFQYLGKVLIYTIFFIPILALIYFITLKGVKRLPDKDGSLIGKKKFFFSDEGLIEETQYNRNEYSWKGVKSIESNRDYIFIFVDTMAAYIFPKRYFKDEADTEQFLNFITEKFENTP